MLLSDGDFQFGREVFHMELAFGKEFGHHGVS